MKEIVCFHNPDEINGDLSNWYCSEFVVKGTTFSSMEQYMMYSKAKVFGDEAIATQIMQNSNVAVIKNLGRLVSGYDDKVWDGMRQIIVYEGLLAKFSQNEELKAQLLATGDATLAECAVADIIWGIGLAMKDEKRYDVSKWKGRNLLGYSLMLVRDKLAGM